MYHQAPPAPRVGRGARGWWQGGAAALGPVTVLWVLMPLAPIAARFTKTTRTEIDLIRNLIESAKAEA